jgi:hypothetical protein
VLINSLTTPTTIGLHWRYQGNFVNHYAISYSYIIRGCGSDPLSERVVINDSNARLFVLRNLYEESHNFTITITAFRGNESATSNQITYLKSNGAAGTS